MFDLVGLGFDLGKHEGGSDTSVVLGVLSDFRPVCSPLLASVGLTVTTERIDKLREVIRGVLRRRAVSRAVARRLFGKARFTVCPVFGRVGLGLLQRLTSVRGSASLGPDSLLADDLLTLYELLPRLRPAQYPLLPRTDRPLILLTDASEEAVLPTGEIGVFLWDPAAAVSYFTALRLPPAVLAWLQGCKWQKKYITQYELLAAACAYTTFPDVVRGRLVHHFLDNFAAYSGLVRGSSNKPHSARIINNTHAAVLELGCQPWFGFVYSEDNIADLPSRGDFWLMWQLGAIFRPCVLPELNRWLV